MMRKNQNLDDDSNMKSSKHRRSFGLSDAETGDFLDLKAEVSIQQIKIDENLSYIGPVLNGKKHGKGLIKNKLGELVYEGYFKDDFFDGEGTLVLENGFIYNGQFLNGKRNGKGILFSGDEKYKYSGDWSEDMKSGEGSETYPDGSSFMGHFVYNKKNGKGKY
jgi:hypothetical protein